MQSLPQNLALFVVRREGGYIDISFIWHYLANVINRHRQNNVVVFLKKLCLAALLYIRTYYSLITSPAAVCLIMITTRQCEHAVVAHLKTARKHVTAC